MKIKNFQTIYRVIEAVVNFLLFRKYSLYIANKRYRGNYCFSFYFLNKSVLERYEFPLYRKQEHLNTYFLKSLHFGNFKNSVLKWVTKME